MQLSRILQDLHSRIQKALTTKLLLHTGNSILATAPRLLYVALR